MPSARLRKRARSISISTTDAGTATPAPSSPGGSPTSAHLSQAGIKRARFEKCFKTVESTDEEVLGALT